LNDTEERHLVNIKERHLSDSKERHLNDSKERLEKYPENDTEKSQTRRYSDDDNNSNDVDKRHVEERHLSENKEVTSLTQNLATMERQNLSKLG